MSSSVLHRDDVLNLAWREVVDGLHTNWTLHEGQIPIARDIFLNDIKSVFVCCGRKFGKTELAIYILWRWAQSNPNSGCYYIAPLQTQAKEIVWANPRLQNFGPRSWLLHDSQGINNTEMRLRFKNGSFIKVDGSDNYDKHRGTEPHIIIYEEFKDHRKEFKQVMTPNLSVFNAPQIFIGTPPEDDGNEAENEYLLTQKEHEEDSTKKFYHAPTWKNPHISPHWLIKEKERLYARGEGDQWEREYEARFVKGGAHKIFPMLRKESVVRPHADLLRDIERDKRKLEWFVWCDPAAASCFAVLFMALNPYTKTWYALDEIYETDQKEMTVVKIGQRLIRIRDELFKDRYVEWRQGYDEAETWFANEMLDHFGESFEPTQKMRTDKVKGVTLIKDILLQNKLVISDRCPKLFWELDSLKKDKNGKIPKKDDHCIAGFELVETSRGSIPIREVQVGDRVLTRQGYKKVIAAWSNGVKPVVLVSLVGGKTISCTGNHLFYTPENQWVRADHLNVDTQLVGINRCTQQELVSMGLNIGGTPTTQSQTCRNITDVRHSSGRGLRLDIYIKQFGYFIMEKSQRAIKYTIKTVISLIIKKKISNASQPKNTEKNTKGIGLHGGEKVLSVVNGPKELEVFDLTVEDAHEFFVNGILVHNCIDTLRYVLHAAHYGLHEEAEWVETQNPMFRGARIQDDFPGFTDTGEKIDEWDTE